MAYQQRINAKDIVIQHSDGSILLQGELELHLLPNEIVDSLNAKAYTIPSLISHHTSSSAITYGDVAGGDPGTIEGDFLNDHLSAVGEYIDVYNRKAPDTRLRFSCTYKGNYLGVRVYLVLYAYPIALTSSQIVVGGTDTANRARGFLLNCLIDLDAQSGLLAYELLIKSTPSLDVYGAWTTNESTQVDTIKKAIYTIFGSGASGGGGGPYDGGGTSEPGEHHPTWDDSSDVIDLPATPTFNLITNNLIHAWRPTVSTLNDLASYLWSNFDIFDSQKTLSKVFTSPLESILSLHVLPFTVPAGSDIGLTLAGFATGVNMAPVTSQFVDVPCGSLEILPYWDNYLDYNPYTKLTLCLPFAGQVTLDPDEVMGKTVSVRYRVDVLTGSFVSFVYLSGDKVLGQYAGNCALSVPISAADYGRFNAAILNVAGTAAAAFGAAATGGLSAGITGAEQVGMSLVQNVQNSKVHVAHSGGLTGAPGFMGVMTPYLIIHRAKQSVPEDVGAYTGYPLNATQTLGDCDGYTVVREIHLDGIPLTEPELEELRTILQGGIVI